MVMRLISALILKAGSPFRKVTSMELKHSITNLIGYEGSQRVFGLSSGTTMFDASVVRVSGNSAAPQVVVVREDFSRTIQVGSQDPLYPTITR